MIIWSSINFPTVIVFPPFAIFSRAATSATYDPRVSPLIYLSSRSILFAFIFRSIKPKNTKIPCCNLFYLAFPWDLSIKLLQLYPAFVPISGTVAWKGLTTPLTRRVASICYLCARVVYVLLRGSPTSLITLVSSLREIPTVDVLHHPFLFVEKPT